MHGPSLATLLVVASLGLTSISEAGTADAVAEARRRLDRSDGVGAVAILEEALPEGGTGKEVLLELLGRAYEVAAKQAQAAGRPREAETYRENLKILARKSRPAKPTPVAASPAPAEVATPTPESPPSPTLLPEGPSPDEVMSNLDPVPTSTRPDPATSVEQPNPSPKPDPSALLPMPTQAEAPEADLPTADAAFAAKDYEQAGKIYARLAGEGRLPAERRDHWVYCRSFEVVKRINARPRNEAEWTSIDAEIEQIRSMNPANWLGEYLRNLAAERLGGPKKTKPARAVVVRGQAPEEPPIVPTQARPSPNAGGAPPVAPSRQARLEDDGRCAAGRTMAGPRIGELRIHHVNPALAAKVAQSAEVVRVEQTKRWTNQAPRSPWQPVCEIYLYPTAAQYAQMTGQPEDSPGFSTMGMNAGRIISRRVNLRADHPALVEAVLPHEVTHVILADFFTMQQIPRWADEGLAVLSEPADEQQRRAIDLVKPLAANRLFPVEALLSMDYPDNRYWGLYYAQSVSLTRFLTEQGTPGQMLQFLQTSQREGYETALRRVYKIDGYADLQSRWLAFAREKTDSRTAVAPATGPDLRVR